MRSEDDIRDALEALADTAPDADEVLARVRATERGERRSAFHTPVLVGLSALATAAAVFAVPLAFDLPDAGDIPVAQAPESTPVRVNPQWQYSFSLDLPSGYQVQSMAITPLYQSATVRTPRADWCEVMVYGWKVFNAKLIPAKRTTVRLDDTTGYLAVFSDPQSFIPGHRPRIAWQWSFETWATTACRNGSDSGRLVAQAVRRSPTSMAMPFRIGYLPKDVKVHAAGTADEKVARTAVGASTVELSASSQRPVNQAFSVTGTTAVRKGIRGLIIDFRPASPALAPGRPILAGDRQAWAYDAGSRLVIPVDGYEVVLTSAPAPFGLPEAELVKVAADIELARDVNDRSTWFDGTEAIP